MIFFMMFYPPTESMVSIDNKYTDALVLVDVKKNFAFQTKSG